MPMIGDTNQNQSIAAEPCELKVQTKDPGTIELQLSGNWKLEQQLPTADAVRSHIRTDGNVRRIIFDTQKMSGWDSGLLTFLVEVTAIAAENQIEVDRQALPEGVGKLLALAEAVPERKGARRTSSREPLFARIGGAAQRLWRNTTQVFTFIGECWVAFMKIFTGKASFQRQDLFLFFQDCGVGALPIVSLICLLFGLILAFVGAVQLMMFGAQIYVADLVGIAVVRVMGAVMCGIIMAGRTGAAFAAQLGTMQVNEEIDALQTLGVSPIEFLVLPRMLALIFMMPLLCVYADIMGIVGGMIVGIGMLDITFLQYVNQTKAALHLSHFVVGLIHSLVFGVLIALSGCLKGMQCGRSASAVGDATTSAVVASIVAIVVATAIITFICNILKI
jgi:phospholipid/cholesterol/gamma-HCH transport system permease protein